MRQPDEEPCPYAKATPGNAQAPRVSSARLLGSSRCLIIEHSGENYCLRLTKNQRLILTKI